MRPLTGVVGAEPFSLVLTFGYDAVAVGVVAVGRAGVGRELIVSVRRTGEAAA